MSAADEALLIFVKAPRPGLVKTRLAVDLGAEAACAAYVRMVNVLCSRLSQLPSVELHYSPADAEVEIGLWLRPGWKAHPQVEGDLGRRLRLAFAQCFKRGAQRAAVIGSDCPEITAADILEAWQALASKDVVLGPATDGGYWLIGLNRDHPGLFENIDWSTPQVLAQTLLRAEQNGLTVHQLRALPDVDSLSDWQAFLAQERPGDQR